MWVSVLVASIAATPPTVAAMLAFFSTRASDRLAARERAASVAQTLAGLASAVGRIESAVERVETGVVELRERVARLEGAQGAHPLTGA
ncbi:MAG: hypothetical protein ACRD0S_04005 [Acidimicrobiales bacterium]